MSARLRLSRRAFLFGAGGAAAVVALGAGGYEALKPGPARLAGRRINVWLSILETGDIQFACPGLEMGQGTTTVLPMIVAEEMGADLSRILVVPVPRAPELYGNPIFDGHLVTADSKTTRGYFDPLRLAGAEARLALITTAAASRGWQEADCFAEGHAVRHRPSGRHVGFAEIAKATTLELPDAVGSADFKPRSTYRLIGTSPAEKDLQAKVTGRMSFGIDARMADTLVAVLARAPQLGATPETVDETAARNVPGVVDVVRLEDAVAVVAEALWPALKGRNLLDIAWTRPEPFDTASERALLEDALARPLDPAHVVRGSVAAAANAEAAPIRIARSFFSPNVTHIALEPMNATVRGTAYGLGAEITGPTQSLDLDMRYGARTWKTAPFLVETRATPAGGAFGRRVLNDVVRDAALVAKAVGRPVQVVRPLADEMRRGMVRPAAAQTIEATADADGTLRSWVHRVASDGVLGRHIPATLEQRGGVDNTSTDGLFHGYRVAAEAIAWHRVTCRPDPGFLRGVSAGYTVFAIETTADAIARAAGRDPLEWRLSHLTDPRQKRVLQAVADTAGWGATSSPDRSRGLSVMSLRESAIATVAEISLESGAVRVTKLWIAADVGLAIHPEKVVGQIEGAELHGVSLALKERLIYAGGATEAEGIADYAMLSADEAPEIDVTLIDEAEATHPFGAGEIGLPGVAPAIANALTALTGAEPTELPLAIGGA
ncbi:xanthine dehydrogenase family protein molybdopterin-binding subunit [Rhodobium gokarnense]|uniref:Isoquinoline 1-oxidoreductase beta subunit n=1 Tax=Rhodobium gokarnense TaxID=364296 RepID=A0ABT3HBP4_9HYPH|nr:molybdopterin cofactor-binding domain-containing protein [Rhodobium gokarnense]MCW2307807.1 isoquinoline 1-oxidoreductase beta subunit [Rhodobium gokarnense]